MGDLETLDIDDAALVEPFEAAAEEFAPGLLSRLPTVATPRDGGGGRHYNYCRKHKTLKGETPAMASGLANRFWTVRDLLNVTVA